MAPNQAGALAHSGQTVVSAAPLFLDHRRVDALSIVADTHAKLTIAIADGDLDAPGVGMLERVAHRLARNPVDFIPQDRMEIARRAFHLYEGFYAIPVVLMSREVFTEGLESMGKLVGF